MDGSIDWPSLQLVAFDVDGTLYRQRPLRLRMAAELACHALFHFSTTPVRVLHHYRRLRERLAEREVQDFPARLLAETARAASVSEDEVARLQAAARR